MKRIVVIILLWSSVTTAFGKKSFEGTVTFGVDISGDGIEQMAAALMPSSYDYNFRNGDVLFTINGGMLASMLGEILMKGKEGTAYMIKRDEKVIYEMDGQNAGGNMSPEIVEGDEVVDILGYKCRKYTITTEANGNKVTQYVWATEDLNLSLPGQSQNLPGAGSSVFIKGLKGFPLKIVSTMMGMKVTMMAKNVEEKKLSPSMFEVPSDYTVKEFDPSVLMGF